MAGTDRFQALVSRLESLHTEIYPQVLDLIGGLVRIGQCQVGTYTGTGAAITVATDGDPKFVLLVNITQECVAFHSYGMTDAHAMKADNGGTAAIAADGITLGTGQFTIGADADINTIADSGFWFVII